MECDAADLAPLDAYRLLTAAIAPRPIAWVTSMGPEGRVNVAPFSFFTVVSTQLTSPPMIVISVGPKPGGVMKDTARNVRDRGEFVVHIANENLAQTMVQTSADYPPDVSEAAAVGLELAPGQRVQVPHLTVAPVHYECKLMHMLDLGRPPMNLIIGEVVRFFVRDEVMVNGRINVEKLRPVARLGGNTYCHLGQLYRMDPEPVP